MINRFNIQIIDDNVATAWKQAEKMLTPESPMMLALRAKNDWRFDSGTGSLVHENMLRLSAPMRVELYWPRNRFTSAIGTYYKGTLRINGYKLPHLSVPKLVAHLCHEYAHHMGFNHGSNYYSKEKGLYSVPYYISDNMEKWLGIKEQAVTTICKRPWYFLGLKKVCTTVEANHA